MTKSISVRDLIQRTEKQFSEAELFYGHGTDNALDEAFYLVMVAAGLEFDCSDEALDTPLKREILMHIESLIDKRINQRIPVAYLVNQAWFAGRAFYVDERVLIPRSPFAELITSQFMPWLSFNNVNSILDIGTGSGCIPVACAYEFPHAAIDAVDIDDDALAVAKENINKHGFNKRIHLYKSNLFEQLDSKKYDLIISNPPYVGHNEMQSLPAEYTHEPGHALEASDNGLELVGQILRQASAHLNDDGVLAVEVGNSMNALIESYPDMPFIWLEFERGGEGVFLLNKTDLEEYQF
ncbi:MAG: 50S ribosomal protein L3 N(5)-glutamine methyltransferase [Proteobacteria bacterium]|nr:50S ribosomal protein L3 N(5)-glutamine methyltransferase [Pseudomonadota bacterium]NOG59727.1 50S ribosomal protein L3 N(5)-glutamine methyltransferase [Pseudomonadota bacterium]